MVHAVSKRSHLLPKSCEERSRLFRRLHFHHRAKFLGEKPTSSIPVVTPRIWYQKMRLSFAVTTSLNLLANFAMVAQGIKNPHRRQATAIHHVVFPAHDSPGRISPKYRQKNRTLHAVTTRLYFLLAHKKPWSYSRNRVHQLLPRGLSRRFLPFCLDLILLHFLRSSSFPFRLFLP